MDNDKGKLVGGYESIDWGTVTPGVALIPVTNNTDRHAEVTAVVTNNAIKEPSLPQALRQAQKMRRDAAVRVYSTDRQLYAQLRKGRTDYWNFYRTYDPNAYKKAKRFGEIITRSKDAVRAMLDALAVFHGNDTL